MNVLVRGVGNVGTTVANVLLESREILGIDRVAVHKGSPAPFLEADLEMLRAQGARVYAGEDGAEEALAGADYVFDCRRAGAARADRPRYERMAGLRGACAQGTETGFGVPFVAGVNDEAIGDARFVQVASCNTHAITSLLWGLNEAGREELVEADLVVVRRAEDVGGHERLVSGTVVARHADALAGTHHAVDAKRVLDTIGCALPMTSSDVTTPSQLMHTLRFHVRFREPVDDHRLAARIERAPLLAHTRKFDANRIFELGRRYGMQGRIYAHAVVVSNNLLVQGPDVRGWAFVPQEGNTILSTLEAFVVQTSRPRPDEARRRLRAMLLRREW